MRRALLAAAGAVCVLMTGLAVATAVFLKAPGSVLTERVVGRAIAYFGEAYAPRWSALAFTAEAITSRRHRYSLHAEDFCAADGRGFFSACFSRLELTVLIAYSRRGPEIERVERFVAVSGDLRADLRRREARAGGPSLALLTAPVSALRVELSSFTVITASAAVFGAFDVGLIPGRRRPFTAATDVQMRDASGLRRMKGALTGATDALEGGAPTFVDLAGSAEFGPRGRVSGAFRIKRDAARYLLTGGGVYAPAAGPVDRIRLQGCEGAARIRPGATRPHEGDLSCRYELISSRIFPEPFRGVKAATGRLSLDARFEKGRYRVGAKADVSPIASWYELKGDVGLRAEGRLDRPWKDAALTHAWHATAAIARFEDLAGFLRETRFSIPAPIHRLTGPLALTLESHGDPRASRQTAHYVLTSDLAGLRQRLFMRAEGDVSAVGLGRSDLAFEHEGELLLKEVALELPRLDIARTPKVFADRRIKTGDEAATPSAASPSAPLRARGSLAVKTEKPLILFSNLARDPVPLALDVVLAYPPAAASGRVEVRRFGVELFRRNAIIDHLNVSLSSAAKSAALEGLVLYRAPSTEIRILILGTTEKPRIEFTSVPPMKREDIIALLIFGKSPDELDPEQTASVGNTETALESRAFGLASLYLFGATPIEHVGYDSATKATSVRLRLPGGANLTLGSDFDQSRQLTVRKPLAPHWAIQSEVTDQGREGRGATTFLEWFNRY